MMKINYKTQLSLLGAIALSPLLLGTVSAYELHEWGTFTSVVGSDGVLLSGLEVEEEALPQFVYALDGMENTGSGLGSFKGLRGTRPLRNVTIKMETPVIYFYSDQPFHAQVKVGFNGGIISQWYPQRSGGETVKKPARPSFSPKGTALEDKDFKKFGGIDLARKRQGSIEWEVDVLGKDADRGLVFKGSETMNWLHPRNSRANVLKVGDEYEDYLFYRGLGNFTLPLKTTVAEDETITLTNTSKQAIPFLFVHEIAAGRKTRFYAIPQGLAAGQSLKVSVQDLQEVDQWQRPVYKAMVNGLVSSGLYPEEARGMIQTWWNSYFDSSGLRVFWVVPTAETDRILPLQVKPSPEKTVRVLVGRSEIIRPSEEKKLLERYRAHLKDPSKGRPWKYGRFGLPYDQRLQKLFNDEAAKKTTKLDVK